MTLSDREIGDVTIIDIDGRITVEEGANIFREGLQQIVRQGRVQLVLNLQEVPYIDSTAMGEIVRLALGTRLRMRAHRHCLSKILGAAVHS
jgi:anti-anti-sigma factor